MIFKKTFVLKFIFIVLAVLSVSVLSLMILMSDKDSEVKPFVSKPFLISLCDFKTGIGEKGMSEKISYLLLQALNQFNEFSVILNRDLQRLKKADKTEGQESNYQNYNVRYELTGKYDRNYNFEAYLKKITSEPEGEENFPITVVGTNLNSLLENEIDDLAADVYTRIFPQTPSYELKIVKVSDYLGGNWDDFCNFFLGVRYQHKLESSKAKYHFKKAKKVLLSNLHLAELHYFNADKAAVRICINRLTPVIHKLPLILRYKVLARKASLDLDFSEQIRYLKKMNEKLYLSKEIIFEIAEAYFYRGDAINAKKYYQKALALDGNYSAAINHLGYCHSYLGEHNEAIRLLEKYKALDRTANSFDSLGDGYFYEGRIGRAEALKEEAISADERSVPWAYLTIADINVLKGRYAKAEENLHRYQSLMKDQKSKAYCLARTAYIASLQGNQDLAFKRINQAVEIADELKDDLDILAESRWIRGMIQIKAKNLEGAEEELNWLKEFITEFKISAEAFSVAYKYYLHLKGLVFEQKGLNDKTVECFEDLLALKAKLSFQITFFHYQFFSVEFAGFYYRHKNYIETASILKSCLEFNPNYIPALELKLKLLEKKNQESPSVSELRIKLKSLKAS
jgi:tetratricopeptide (TPR) repeat protein